MYFIKNGQLFRFEFMKVFTVSDVSDVSGVFAAGHLTQTVNLPPMVFYKSGKCFQFKAFHKTTSSF